MSEVDCGQDTSYPKIQLLALGCMVSPQRIFLLGNQLAGLPIKTSDFLFSSLLHQSVCMLVAVVWQAWPWMNWCVRFRGALQLWVRSGKLTRKLKIIGKPAIQGGFFTSRLFYKSVVSIFVIFWILQVPVIFVQTILGAIYRWFGSRCIAGLLQGHACYSVRRLYAESTISMVRFSWLSLCFLGALSTNINLQTGAGRSDGV